MFARGRPQVSPTDTQINFGRAVVFSADLCYNGVYRRAGACSRRNEHLELKKAAGVNPRPTKGDGLSPVPL